MQYKTNQTFTSLLSNDPALSKLIAKIKNLDQLNQVISTKLDASLLNNCVVSNLRDGTLILSTNSPAWNHKLRFQSLDLLSSLRADPRWSGLKAIELRVDYIPLQSNSSSFPTKTTRISSANATLISQLADNISYQPLAAVLKRLATLTPPSRDADTQ